MKTEKPKFVWHNGKFVKFDDARIHIMSHALHYGSGAFEGIRSYETPRGPAVFRLSEHVARLFRSASALGMHVPYTKKRVEDVILKTVSLNKFKNCYVRPIIFYGEGRISLNPKGNAIHVAIAAWPWGSYFGENKMISTYVSRYIRFHPDSIIPGTKISGYYATSVLAMLEAKARGFDESILLDHKGHVAEGTGENIFIVKNGKLIAVKSPSILPGITRESVITIAKDLGVPAAEKEVSLEELVRADEVFLTGTATEVAPVGKVNTKAIGRGGIGPVTRKIKSAYLDAAHGRLPAYRKWLSFV